MARRKVKLAFIINDSARRAMYNKRKNSLLKKLMEITTLCGVEGGLVVYSPSDAHPEVYPSPEGMQRVLERFITMEETDQTKKMFDQEAFFHHRIEKATEQLKRLQRENNERETTRVMFEAMAAPRVLEGMGVVELSDLRWRIDQYTVDVKRQLDRLTEEAEEARAREEEAERARANAAAEAAGPAGAATDQQRSLLEMMNSFQEELDPILAMDNFRLE